MHTYVETCACRVGLQQVLLCLSERLCVCACVRVCVCVREKDVGEWLDHSVLDAHSILTLVQKRLW